MKTFVDANPNEVVSLLLVNIDDQPASAFASVYESVGLDQLSWSPPAATVATSAWPTLGSMIDSNKRIVTFMDNSADFATAPYILDGEWLSSFIMYLGRGILLMIISRCLEFSNMWEDYFDVTDASGFNCTIQRFTGDTTGEMYLINHYLYEISGLFGGSTPVPDKTALPVTNAVSGSGSLGQEAGVTCPALHGRAPTFLLVDFYDWGQGSVFEVAANVNGVQYQSKSIAAQNGTDGSTSGSSGTTSSSTNGGEQGAMLGRSTVWTAVVVMACVVTGSLVVI